MEVFLPIFAEWGLPGFLFGYLVWSNSKKDDQAAATATLDAIFGITA